MEMIYTSPRRLACSLQSPDGMLAVLLLSNGPGMRAQSIA
ncbi:hypothetical protein J2X56_002504 [Herbaspirillum sp. 1173]|nr:hypothetical protein [Herbaspirillum sp. 1130]MDR6740486.1 hypothetical protein [Herbaspirillum sp. 1173]